MPSSSGSSSGTRVATPTQKLALCNLNQGQLSKLVLDSLSILKGWTSSRPKWVPVCQLPSFKEKENKRREEGLDLGLVDIHFLKVSEVLKVCVAKEIKRLEESLKAAQRIVDFPGIIQKTILPAPTLTSTMKRKKSESGFGSKLLKRAFGSGVGSGGGVGKKRKLVCVPPKFAAKGWSF
ncbi:hypothetical protein HDV05_008820 [Chytridiales sp. JEL 0842]|nr:hypothetical protein HDV05_008820 [Chytridiales sp. JEL 0842]